MTNFMKMGLLIGACAIFCLVVPIGCGGPDTEGPDAGPDHLDGAHDANVNTDAGPADAGPNSTDGGVTDAGSNLDAGPTQEQLDWQFALAVLNGKKWLAINESSPTPVYDGTFALDVYSIPGCATGKRLTQVFSDGGDGDEFCFNPETMQYSSHYSSTVYSEVELTFCNDCASYTGWIKERCLHHRHISGNCHPDWSDTLFVDGPWVIIKTRTNNGSTTKSTYVSGD